MRNTVKVEGLIAPVNQNNFANYFKKLKLEPTHNSFEFVEALQKKHLETFSFNNIAVLLQKEISLDVDKIMEKIVHQNLGGYCFEHNALMYGALKSLGYDVRILMAKVLNNQEIDMPRTHRITLLKWQGSEYLIDVGFGAMCPKKVLDIHAKNEETDYRITAYSNGCYRLEMLRKKDYFFLYQFDLGYYTEADCVMGNFYSSTHPNAVFVNNFVVALRLPKLTLSFINGIYHRISDDETDVIHVSTALALQKILNEDFLISLGLKECEVLIKNQ